MRKKFVGVVLLLLLVCTALQTSYAAGDESAKSPEQIRIPVVMYHHINKNSKYWNDYTISPEQFREDLEYIRESGYNVITAKQLIDFADGRGELPEKPIMLTFDDGFESFLTYAVPLLEEYNMPAVMAVVGRYTDMYSETEDHNVNYSHLNWQELEKLSSSPVVELAVHTYNMHSLGQRRGCSIKPGEDVQQFKTEFGADLDKIEGAFVEHLGFVPEIFAYPYGLYCNEARQVLESRGYKLLLTCDERVNELSGNPEELLKIGRFNRPSRLTSREFFQKLA